jgi:Tfp pilus assembly protein FimT
MSDKVNLRQIDFDTGFSVLEMTIVMGLLALVGALGLAMTMDSMRGGAFRNSRDSALSALQRARSLSLNSICQGTACVDGKSHGVYFSPAARGVVIFQITQGLIDYSQCDMPVNEFVEFDSGTVVAGATTTIIFNRLDGTLAGGATSTSVTLTDDAGRNSTIEVNFEGRIDWAN